MSSTNPPKKINCVAKRLLFAFIVIFPSITYGQGIISGVIVDSLSLEPLPSATVYINGTALGTTTDNEGRFELKNVLYPATVIFSFVGYETQALNLSHNPGELTIRLKANSELPEVVISGKNKKVNKKDLDLFKSIFLGDDKWGKHATIKNEKALIIDMVDESSYHVKRKSFHSYATPYKKSSYTIERHIYFDDTIKVNKNELNAWATEPLIIDLPLLGYVLYVDLVKFAVVQVNDVVKSDMLGYFYYKPYEKVSKRQAEIIEANRKKAYYGSSQHFLRSLSQDRLLENGFMVTTTEQIVRRKKIIPMNVPLDIKKYCADSEDNIMNIYGLKDKKISVRYYHGNFGVPTNLKEKELGLHLYSKSGITPLRDTCTFLKDGIVIDNNILFTGDFSKRRVGTYLPDDYIPPADTSIIMVKDTVDYASELMKYVNNIHLFNSLFPQEKVYLEFDNTAYFQGENIWYKAFVTNATTLKSAPSGVLYVDFLAPTGQLITQQKLKIVAGQADGAIPLLDVGTQQTREKRGIVAYPSGFYEIRAYTQNMLDFSSEAIFSRVIPVYTQPKYVGEYNKSHVETNLDNLFIENLRGESKEQKGQNRFDIAFYPEGGDLVYNLPCRVAFKITGNYNFDKYEELTIPGISDNEYDVHDGMGSFIITPNGSESVQFKRAGNVYRTYILPKPVSSGYSMISDIRSDSLLEVNIWRTPDRVGEQTALAVMCRGEVIYFEEIKDLENSHLEIDCSNWPAGVCRMTLFNRDGKILSSRSIFHNNSHLYNPTITVNTDSLSNKQFSKEVLEFKLTDESGNPLRDRFCLAVRDAADYGNGRTDNLLTNLLLSSDLKGYIHDPAWYLECNDEEHREALNLLTLVQGWERYEWQTMTGLEEFEEKHRIEEGLTMNGWILSYRKREPVSDIGVYVSMIPTQDKTKFEIFEYHTDSTGYFAFDLSDFYNKGNFTINLMSTRDNGKSKYEKSKRIRFERADKPTPRPYLKQETDLSNIKPQIYDYEIDFSNDGLTANQLKKMGILLDEVDIEEEKQKIRFIDYDTFTSFETEEDAELELDQGEYTTDLKGYFLERGIRFDNYTNNEDEGEGKGEGRSSDVKTIRPYFYVHNLSEYKMLSFYESEIIELVEMMDMIDVKSIIIYDKPMFPRDFMDLIPLEVNWRFNKDPLWFFRMEQSNVRYYLVDIQLKEDRQLLFDWEIRNLGRRTTTVKGFAKPVQFYSPDYSEVPLSGEIDPRRTLYWNPNVITDEEGHARVEFYNNNFTRKFNINAAGITPSGIPYILNQVW